MYLTMDEKDACKCVIRKQENTDFIHTHTHTQLFSGVEDVSE